MQISRSAIDCSGLSVCTSIASLALAICHANSPLIGDNYANFVFPIWHLFACIGRQCFCIDHRNCMTLGRLLCTSCMPWARRPTTPIERKNQTLNRPVPHRRRLDCKSRLNRISLRCLIINQFLTFFNFIAPLSIVCPAWGVHHWTIRIPFPFIRILRQRRSKEGSENLYCCTLRVSNGPWLDTSSGIMDGGAWQIR